MKDKDELRKYLKTLRANFKGELRERADEAILQNFLRLCERYESFLIYNSISSEADTVQLVSCLFSKGKRVFLPRVEGENMVAVPYSSDMQVGAFGIKEPQGQAYNGEIEVTVIPLLGVNSGGYRIGYGKGYYDRYLKHRKTLKVGLGYSFQITEFEQDSWDIPLEYFVCEKGIYNENNFW